MPASGRVILLALTLTLIRGLAPAAPLPVRVVGDRVNLRAAPAETAEVVGQLTDGQELLAPDGIGEAWVRVVVPDGISLWIYRELVRDGVVAVDKAQVRAGPGLQYKRVGMLDRGASVAVRGELGDWLKIAPPSTCSLWVSRDYLAVTEADVAAALVTAPAAPTATAPDDPALEQLPVPEPVPVPMPAATTAPDPATANAPRRAGMRTEAAAFAEPWPAALRAETPDSLRPQGFAARFEGRLLRSGNRPPLPPAAYLVVQDNGNDRPATLCHLAGMEGQLAELVGERVVVQGHAWYPQAATIPVLVADDLRRLE